MERQLLVDSHPMAQHRPHTEHVSSPEKETDLLVQELWPEG